MRRHFLKFLTAGVLACVAHGVVAAPAATEAPIKVVYDVSEGLPQASRAIANIRNELIAEPNTKIVVVTHGEGVRFLVAGTTDNLNRPFSALVAALVARGVEFRVCQNTLNAFGIASVSVIPQAVVVLSGVAEVARLQAREGFAYIHP